MSRPFTGRCVAALLITAAVSAPLGCATPVGQRLGEDEKVIHFRSYAVGTPGTSWGSTVDRDAEQVRFQRVKTDYFGSGKRSNTQLIVRRIEFTSAGAAAGEEALARDYLAAEERNLDRDAKPGGFELRDVKKGERTIGGKRVYSMTYETRAMTEEHRIDCESAVYLYFTPDFSDRRAFYGFFGTDCCPAGRPPQLASDLDVLEELVQSFAIQGPSPEAASDRAGR